METLAERQPEPENPKVQQPRLTAADVGIFNPTAMPDHLPAMQFIDDFTDAVAYHGEDATRQVLRRCCAGPIARTWLTSLDDVDRQALRSSTRDWERLIRRDFMPPKDIMEGIARAEQYDWTQDRTPAEYFTHKLALLRIAGIVDQDRVIRELHRGFATAPQLHAPINNLTLKKSGKSLSEYRLAMQNYQDAARLLYEEVFGVFGELGPHKQPRPRADGLCGVTTPKPSECRTCHIAFPSRSRLHEHLRASGHTERRCGGNGGQPDSEIIETGSTTNQAIRKRYREAFGQEPARFIDIDSNHRQYVWASPINEIANPKTFAERKSKHRQPEYAFMGITVPSMATGASTTIPLGPEETYSPTPAARRPAATPLEPQKASEESWCIDNAETVSSAADETYIPTPPHPDRFNNNTGYVGVTFKERGYPRSPVSDRASLRSSFTTVPAAFPLSLRISSMLRETSAARRLRLSVRRKLMHWQAHPGRLKKRRVK